MFTGIVDHCGCVVERLELSTGVRLTITSDFSDFDLGESIAVDGICLTVTQFELSHFTVVLSKETLDVTTATHFSVQTPVNLERALRATDRMGGHFVAGHVDQMAQIANIEQQDDFWIIRFEGIKKDNQKYLSAKGSVTINGVSLTINDLTTDGFLVTVIPHTLQQTNLKFLAEGQAVNIEFDLMAKLVASQLAAIVKNRGEKV